MNHFFENMIPFEAILLVMGIIAFLVLLFLLVWSVMKKRPVKSLFSFFILPIVMVAYPSIKSIKIGNILFDINHYAKEVSENPKDTVARTKLKDAITAVNSSSRLANSGKGLLAVAHAQLALGNYDSTSLYLNKAEKKQPDPEKLKTLKRDLHQKEALQNKFSGHINKLNEQINQLKQSQDTQTLKEIGHVLSTMKVPVYIQPEEMITLAKSYALTGNKKQSLEIVNTLSQSEASSEKEITQVKDSISKGLYQKKYLKPDIQPETIVHPQLNNATILNKVVIKKQ